jgi:mannan endo-1,4-beta-mannosidase
MAAAHEQDHRPRGASRRALLAGTITGAAGLMAGAGVSPLAAVASTGTLATAGLPSRGTFPGRPREFVTTRGGSFSVGGAAWRFGGTNTYYLHQQSHYMIDSVLNDAAAMSLAVVRAWAFADGSGGSYTALQPKPYVYDSAAFD